MTPSAGPIILFYALGLVILAAELYIPSGGALGIAALCCFAAAVYRCFDYGTAVGMTALATSVIGLPLISFVGLRFWLKSSLGRRVIPSSPEYDPKDSSVPVDQLEALIGKTGNCVSPLRPVGFCVFDGIRVSCVAEVGIIETGSTVEGVGLKSGNLAVVLKSK